LVKEIVNYQFMVTFSQVSLYFLLELDEQYLGLVIINFILY